MLGSDGTPHCPYCDQPMLGITRNLSGESFGCEKCADGGSTFLHHSPKPIEKAAPMTHISEIKGLKP